MRPHKLLARPGCRTTGKTSGKRMAATIGKTVRESTPHWPEAPVRPKGAPIVLVILCDDVGFSDFGCDGSPIVTRTIDDGRAVAAEVGEADIVEQDDQDVGGAFWTDGRLGSVGSGLPD